MKKGMLGLLLVLVLLVAALPYIAGSQVQSVSHDQIVQANESAGHLMSFELINYDRGYLSSTAQTEVVMHLSSLFPEMDLPKAKIRFNHQIKHGPLVKTEEGMRAAASYVVTHVDESSLPADMLAEIKPFFLKPNEWFVSRDLVGFYGDMESHVTLTGIRAKEEQVSLSFGGAEARFRTNLNNMTLVGDLALGGLKIDRQGEYAALSGMQVQWDVSEVESGLWLGDQQYTVQNIDVGNGAMSLAKLDVMNMDVKSQTHGDVMDSMFSMRLQGIESVMPVVDNASFNASLKQLPLTAVRQLQTLIKELEDNLPANADRTQREAAYMQAAMGKGAELVNAYMQQGLGLELDVSMDNQWGKGKADLGLTFNGVEGGKFLEVFMANPETAIKGFSGQLNMDIDQAMLAVIPGAQQLDQGVEMGFLKVDGAKYVIQLGLDNATLSVNDALKLPVMQMLAGMK